jgi:hypothetical protein
LEYEEDNSGGEAHNHEVLPHVAPSVRDVSYELPNAGHERWPALWAALRSDPGAKESDLLFVNFDERGSGAGPEPIDLVEGRCFPHPDKTDPKGVSG